MGSKICDRTETGAIYLDNFVYAIDAAIAGLGVVLADQITIAASLKSGSLVQPLDYSLPADGRYYLVYSKEKAYDPVVKNFVRWIKDEIMNSDAKDPLKNLDIEV